MDEDFKQKVERFIADTSQVLERINQHAHNGVDFKRVQFSNLDTVIYSESELDPSSLGDGAGETLAMTVTGAKIGDFVLVSPPYDLQDITVTGYVADDDSVEIRIQNESGGTVDLGSGVWAVYIIKRPVKKLL